VVGRLSQLADPSTNNGAIHTAWLMTGLSQGIRICQKVCACFVLDLVGCLGSMVCWVVDCAGLKGVLKLPSVAWCIAQAAVQISNAGAE